MDKLGVLYDQEDTDAWKIAIGVTQPIMPAVLPAAVVPGH